MAYQGGAYPSLWSLTWLRELILLPGWDDNPSQVTSPPPSFRFSDNSLVPIYNPGVERGLVRLFWFWHKLFLACGMTPGERSARDPALFLPDLRHTFSRLVSNLPAVGETRACSANNEDLVWNPNLSTRSPALDHWVSHTFFGIPVILTLY